MARRPARLRKSRHSIERITLNLASMIDVTFLLLIYFMVTTVIARPEDKLSPALSVQREGKAGIDADYEPQIIEAQRREQGPVYVLNGRMLEDRRALAATLEPLPKSKGIFVKVHDKVPVGFAVAAIQVARDAGFKQVTYVPATE